MAEASVELSGWERALMAAEKVKERLRRATRALDAAAVPYAVVGGNAVAEWVGRIDEGAVRNTRDVDLLLRRGDFPAARAASKLPASSIITASTLIRSSTGRKANRAAESISFTPAKKFSRTTSRLCRTSTNRNAPANFKSPTSKPWCG